MAAEWRNFCRLHSIAFMCTIFEMGIDSPDSLLLRPTHPNFYLAGLWGSCSVDVTLAGSLN